jgi:uncharacterized protein YegP (UPF0339 family)
MAHPSFIIAKTKNDKFQFTLTAKNGQVILTSEQYNSKSACRNGLESVKKNAEDASKFTKLTAKNGKFYFNLIATNGQIIGTSQMYSSESSRDNGIQSVEENAPHAGIEETV